MTGSTFTTVAGTNQRQIWNGRQLGGAFSLAAALLDARHEYVNALNVFPVPDGDTGTNMAMTMKAAVQAIPAGEHSVSAVGKHLAGRHTDDDPHPETAGELTTDTAHDPTDPGNASTSAGDDPIDPSGTAGPATQPRSAH